MPSPPRQEDRESSLSRLVIAPLTFISFLISLFLVDTYTTSSRRRDRTPPASGGWLSGVLWRPKAGSPYAYVSSPGGQGRKGEGEDGRSQGREEWVWHTKQRKMLRMEVVDAFELRRWVVGALGVVVVVLGVGWWWFWRWAWGRWGW